MSQSHRSPLETTNTPGTPNNRNTKDAMQSPSTSTPDFAEAWDRVKRRLRADLGEDVFSSWFGRLELVEIVDGTVHLSVPTRFLKSWIQSHYIDRVRQLVAEELQGARDIELSVRSALQKMPSRSKPMADTPSSVARPTIDSLAMEHLEERTLPTEADGLSGSPLDRRLTFASFLVAPMPSRMRRRNASPASIAAPLCFIIRFTSIPRSVSAKPICCMPSAMK